MKSNEEYYAETLDKIADMLEEQAKYIRELPQEEVEQVLLLFGKLRYELENGKYDTAVKKWSDLDWRFTY